MQVNNKWHPTEEDYYKLEEAYRDLENRYIDLYNKYCRQPLKRKDEKQENHIQNMGEKRLGGPWYDQDGNYHPTTQVFPKENKEELLKEILNENNFNQSSKGSKTENTVNCETS